MVMFRLHEQRHFLSNSRFKEKKINGPHFHQGFSGINSTYDRTNFVNLYCQTLNICHPLHYVEAPIDSSDLQPHHIAIQVPVLYPQLSNV